MHNDMPNNRHIHNMHNSNRNNEQIIIVIGILS